MAALPVGDHTISGTLAGVEPRGDWMRFSLQREGQQYPDKLDTKQPEIIAAAMAYLGQQVTVQVTCQDSGNPNPHRPGTTYMNRYLNAIGPSTGAQSIAQAPAQQQAPAPAWSPQAQQPATVPVPQTHGDPFMPDARDLKIYRQVAYKTAVEAALSGAIEYEPVAIVQAAEVAMGYLRYGPARFGVASHDQQTQPVPAQPQQQAAAPAQQTLGGDPGSDAPHPADDDIPF